LWNRAKYISQRSSLPYGNGTGMTKRPVMSWADITGWVRAKRKDGKLMAFPKSKCNTTHNVLSGAVMTLSSFRLRNVIDDIASDCVATSRFWLLFAGNGAGLNLLSLFTMMTGFEWPTTSLDVDITPLTDNIDKSTSSGSVYLGIDSHLHLFWVVWKRYMANFPISVTCIYYRVSVMYCGKRLPSFICFTLTNPCRTS
jgi:hypothetical protein